MNKTEINELSRKILDCSIEVHKNLGPGLLESVYETCLEDELKSRNLRVRRQVNLPIIYKGKELSKEFCVDLFVEDEIIIELKTVEYLMPIHEAQLLTYLKLANKKLGLLINFNEVLVKNGFRRLLNGNLPEL